MCKTKSCGFLDATRDLALGYYIVTFFQEIHVSIGFFQQMKCVCVCVCVCVWGGVMPLTFDKKTQTLSLVKNANLSGFKHCFIHLA